jgi:hypothetical protein
MPAQQSFGVLHAGGDGGDGKRRSVGRQHRAGIDQRFELCKELLFDGQVLDDGLNDQVATGQIAQHVAQFDGGQRRLRLGGLELAFLD